MMRRWGLLAALTGLACLPAAAIDRPEVTFKVFQFPPTRSRGSTQHGGLGHRAGGLCRRHGPTGGRHRQTLQARSQDPGRARAGGLGKGLNRLYFLYEAYDNYWDFSRPDLHNDTSRWWWMGTCRAGRSSRNSIPTRKWISGTSISRCTGYTRRTITSSPRRWTRTGRWCGAAILDQGSALGQRRVLLQLQAGRGGQAGAGVLDHAVRLRGCEGPQRAVESVLYENKPIGLSWAVLDYDDVNANAQDGFWNLSRKHTMYGNASELVTFRLMPLEAQFRKKIEARWSFKVVDMSRRLVAFQDHRKARLLRGSGISATARRPPSGTRCTNTRRRGRTTWSSWTWKGPRANPAIPKCGTCSEVGWFHARSFHYEGDRLYCEEVRWTGSRRGGHAVLRVFEPRHPGELPAYDEALDGIPHRVCYA